MTKSEKIREMVVMSHPYVNRQGLFVVRGETSLGWVVKEMFREVLNAKADE